MRALLIHARKVGLEFKSLANRPNNIVHEKIEGKEKQKFERGVAAFITVEKGDVKEEVILGITKEIRRMCKDLGRYNVIVIPFAHLSNNIPEPKKALEIINEIEGNLRIDCKVIAGHFGSNKSLLLEMYGHPGNARYREF